MGLVHIAEQARGSASQQPSSVFSASESALGCLPQLPAIVVKMCHCDWLNEKLNGQWTGRIWGEEATEKKKKRRRRRSRDDAKSHQPDAREAGEQRGQVRVKVIKPRGRERMNRNGFI